MFDYAGWFVASAVCFTLLQVVPNFKIRPSMTDLVQQVFEANNVYSKIDDAKLYPFVIKKGGK